MSKEGYQLYLFISNIDWFCSGKREKLLLASVFRREHCQRKGDKNIY